MTQGGSDNGQAAQRERDLELRLALDVSGPGVWSWDAASNRPAWDDRFHAQYGFAPEAPRTFDTWLARVHEDDRPQVLDRLDRLRHANRDDAWDVVFRVVQPSGALSWMPGLVVTPPVRSPGSSG